MFDIPEKLNLKHINNYNSLEQLLILKNICHKIYINRNIAVSQENILDNLEKIDILFKDNENFN